MAVIAFASAMALVLQEPHPTPIFIQPLVYPSPSNCHHQLIHCRKNKLTRCKRLYYRIRKQAKVYLTENFHVDKQL